MCCAGRAVDISSQDKSGDVFKYEQSQMTMDCTVGYCRYNNSALTTKKYRLASVLEDFRGTSFCSSQNRRVLSAKNSDFRSVM